jgi:hypothetical protein
LGDHDVAIAGIEIGHQDLVNTRIERAAAKADAGRALRSAAAQTSTVAPATTRGIIARTATASEATTKATADEAWEGSASLTVAAEGWAAREECAGIAGGEKASTTSAWTIVEASCSAVSIRAGIRGTVAELKASSAAVWAGEPTPAREADGG